ncbi:MAG: MBL fold metallo-hydrolase [Acidobacteriota bacterium]
MRFGSFEIFFASDGNFLLDGGAMFGVVPKVLWEKKNKADEFNRIQLSMNSMAVSKKDILILIETGIGEKYDSKFEEIYGLNPQINLIKSLKVIDIEPEDINFVINTHLHFDHCGGNTKKFNNKIVPTFRNAKYLIQKAEWENALNPDDRSKASYLNENILPLEEHKNLELVDGDVEIVEGVYLKAIPGHTRGHQCVLIDTGSERIFFTGDLIPTSSHVPISYVMAYDLFPLETINNKKIILQQAYEENWILAFYHDPEYSMVRVVKDAKEKWSFEPFG